MTSQYPHGHTYDLFVSYSTRDLTWVRAFYDDLVADVNRFADLDIFPFLDKARLQPGYVWDEQLLAAAGDSAILVPVLSPRFFRERLLPEGSEGIHRRQWAFLRISASQPHPAGKAALFSAQRPSARSGAGRIVLHSRETTTSLTSTNRERWSTRKPFASWPMQSHRY